MTTQRADPPGSADSGDLFARHGNDLLRYARRRVADSDADDIVSAVLDVAARKIAEGTEPDEPLAWLYGLAFQVVRSHRSKSGRLSRLRTRIAGVREPEPGLSPDPAVDVPSALWVSQVIDILPEKDAELLRLIVFENLTVTAAAGLIGVSVGAAHTRLYRIRAGSSICSRPLTNQKETCDEPKPECPDRRRRPPR